MLNRRQVLAAQLLSELESELRAAEEKVGRLRGQIEAAKALASTLNSDDDIVAAKSESGAVLLRAKNTADLVVRFLLDRCPGATIPELHAEIVASGASIGDVEYFYTVMKKLEKKGSVRRDVNSQGGAQRYFAVISDENLSLQSQESAINLRN